MSAIHLPWIADSDPARAACGTWQPPMTTLDYEAVTCHRCRRTRKWRERLVVKPEKDQTEWLSPEQSAAVKVERNHTRTEVMTFILEGDMPSAQARLQRGFERQCRLAGLDRAVRESREKEMVAT